MYDNTCKVIVNTAIWIRWITNFSKYKKLFLFILF